MPLTPPIRPVTHISRTADKPISAPPAREAIGVNDVETMRPPDREHARRGHYFSSFVFSNILIYRSAMKRKVRNQELVSLEEKAEEASRLLTAMGNTKRL